MRHAPAFPAPTKVRRAAACAGARARRGGEATRGRGPAAARRRLGRRRGAAQTCLRCNKRACTVRAGRRAARASAGLVLARTVERRHGWRAVTATAGAAGRDSKLAAGWRQRAAAGGKAGCAVCATWLWDAQVLCFFFSGASIAARSALSAAAPLDAAPLPQAPQAPNAPHATRRERRKRVVLPRLSSRAFPVSLAPRARAQRARRNGPLAALQVCLHPLGHVRAGAPLALLLRRGGSADGGRPPRRRAGPAALPDRRRWPSSSPEPSGCFFVSCVPSKEPSRPDRSIAASPSRCRRPTAALPPSLPPKMKRRKSPQE